jgi:hypothetical protein
VTTVGGHIGAPINAVLQLEASVALTQVTEALEGWLHEVHGVDLESAEHENLIVEWKFSDDDHFVCQLVAADSYGQVRRTVTALRDDVGVVAIVEESPFTAVGVAHAVVDLSESTQLLLRALAPLTTGLLGLSRGVVNDLCTTTSDALLGTLQNDLAPGVILAVTADAESEPTSAQMGIMESLLGLSVAGFVPLGADLLGDLGITVSPRPGSLISISRAASGLDAHVIGSTSLRTKPDSARRLVVRRQLSAPVPFDLERRRSAAMTRLLGASQEIDLPAAMQLLDEESQRVNELGNRVKELEALLEQAYEEQDAALGELDDAQSQVRFLERAFRELGEVPLVEAEEDEDWRPESCSDALVAARETLTYLIIGPTESTCEALDSHPKRGIWAKKLWSALRALNDYCRAKADGKFSGDITMYRDNTPSGGIPLLADYAAHESQPTTNDPQLKAIRTFSVPTSIHANGQVYMQQHLKVERGGQSAPRVYMHDDSGGSTQRIYIGYIGPHLPTSSAF